jgi:hypothetical protein
VNAIGLRNAERLLDGNVGAAGSSARLAAFLARQALEELVDERCRALGADVPGASMRSKLVIMRSLDTTECADAAAIAWNRLSNVCHHHAYELAPTVSEVRHLCGVVAVLLNSGAGIDKPTTTNVSTEKSHSALRRMGCQDSKRRSDRDR